MSYFIKQTSNSPFWGLDFGDAVSPTFVDLNGDGILDLVVGTSSGELKAYIDTGASNASEGERYQGFILSGLTSVDFGTTISPTFADIDGDGDDDAIISLTNGQFRYFQNDGGSFTELTGNLNPLDDFFENLQQSKNQLTQEILTPAESSSSPEDTHNNEGLGNTTAFTGENITFFDIDGDGDDDKLVRNTDGNIDIYLNEAGNYTFDSTDQSQNIDTPATVDETIEGSRVTEPNEAEDSTVLNPTFVDIDGDGDSDVVVGHSNGNVDIYLNNGGDYVFDSTLMTSEKDASPALADIDGDGDLDALVGTKFGRLLYYRREGSEFVQQTGKENPFQYIDVGDDAKPSFADIDGDGDPDLVIGNRDGELSHYDNYKPTPSVSRLVSHHYEHFDYNSGWTSDDKWPRHLADVNGDGRADIVAFGSSVVQVALGQEDGSFGTKSIAYDHLTYNNGGWTSQNKYPRHLADVNGDGRADIVAFGGSGVYVALAQQNEQGDITFADHYKAYDRLTYNHGWTSQNRNPRHLADVNGDGRADIVAFGASGVYVALGQSDGKFGKHFKAYNDFTSNGGWTSDDKWPSHLADVNGDGRDDIVVFGTGGVAVAMGQSDGTFQKHTRLTDRFTHLSGGWTSQNKYPRHLADVNGDGLADLVGFGHSSVKVRQNNTIRPDPAADLFFESEFTSTGNSMWGEGSAFQFDWDFKEWSGFQPITWDIGNDNKSFGGFAQINSGGTHGNIDFDAGIEIDSGSIDTTLPIITWFGMPEEDPSSNQDITLKTGGFLSEEATFETLFPYVNAYLGADLNIAAFGPSLTLDVPLISDPTYNLFQEEIDINEAIEFSFDSRSFSLSSDDVDLVVESKNKKTGKKSKLDLNDFLDFEIQSLEDMDLTSTRVDDFTLSATNSNPFFNASLDLDNLLSKSKRIPPLEHSGSWGNDFGSVWANINLFDADLNVEFTVQQTFTLEVDTLTGLFTFEDGTHQAFNVGDEIDFLLSPSRIGNDGRADINVTITPEITLRNQTSILYDMDLELSALSGSAGFDVGVDLGAFGSINYSNSAGMAPVWSESIDLVSGSIYDYDQTFTLDGFGSQAYSFSIEV